MTKKLTELNKADLVRVAELTETSFEDGATKADILVALQENDVDEEYYEGFVAPQLESEKAAAEAAEAVEEEPKVKPAEETTAPAGTVTLSTLGYEDKTPVTETQEETEAYEPESDSDEVLVRYTGFSQWYEKMGHRFRKAHPFTLVAKSEVDALLEASDLLRLASPKEAKDFYA